MFAQLINNIDVHDYYVSTTEVNFSHNNHIQITIKVFIDDFEEIIINRKSGEKLKMYRKKKEQIDKGDLENFTSSWTAFQQNLS